MNYSFGNWVKRRRKRLDLTQQELAQRVGCSLATIVKIEADERRPSRQIAELLYQFLEVPADQRDLFLKVARQEKTIDALGETLDTDPFSPHHTFKIPISPNLIVGREIELAEITRLILDPHCRLLTLTGQGGVGKKCLVIHAAVSLANSKQRQVAFVDLTPVSDREQTVTAIADAFGIVLYAASDRANQLISYLQGKAQMLILDNFEHLTTEIGCIDLISEILRGAPEIKMVITSREPLQLQSEWVFEVQGLPVPKDGKLEEVDTNSAVTLFVQRANQAHVGFQPTKADLPAIAQICELVEGLPLGIELAAAWVRTLTCDEIAREIHTSMDFLATSVRDLPERHRSIRAAIEHSWKLLNGNEQAVLRRLSIFRGGFNRQAAEVVAKASLRDLLALVSKSLVYRAGTGRYDMHELIRQYALDRLKEDRVDSEEVQMRHSQYYANLLEQRGSALKGADREIVVAELIADLPNLRKAWRWASSHQQVRLLSRSADTLFWLYESRSNCREGVPLYGKAVEGLRMMENTAGALDHWALLLALGQALSYQGYFLFRQGQHPQGREALKSALALLENISDRHSREVQMAFSTTIVFLGTVTSIMGDFMVGDAMLQEGLRLKQGLGDQWGAAFCLRQMGLSGYYQGEYARSYEALEQSLMISREMGNTWSIAASLNQLGIAAHSLGKEDQAQKYLSDGLELSRLLEDRASIAVALDGLGLVYAARGQAGEARDMFEESIARWNEIGEQGGLAQTLIHYGDALLKWGDVTQARERFAYALSVASRAQITPVLLDACIGEAEIRMAKGEGESAFPLIWSVSQHPSCSHATRLRADQLCSALELQLAAQDVKEMKETFDPKRVEVFVREILTTIS